MFNLNLTLLDINLLFLGYTGETHDSSRTLKDIVVSTIMSATKIGPKLYGLFPMGRLEEFLNVT